MPILALTLLGVTALQRRRNNFAGISLGLAAAMKLTAWPMAIGALLVARDSKSRSDWKRIAAWVVAIVVVTVTPFAIRAPWAFMSNVFAFPLGLTGVASPAASALPGHILTTLWAPAGHILAPVTFLVGGYFMAKYLRRHWPLTLSQVLAILSLVFLTMMCVASATRIGYVIYPLNFALWSWGVHGNRRARKGIGSDRFGVLKDPECPVHQFARGLRDRDTGDPIKTVVASLLKE